MFFLWVVEAAVAKAHLVPAVVEEVLGVFDYLVV
jgi:hypothetical protein